MFVSVLWLFIKNISDSNPDCLYVVASLTTYLHVNRAKDVTLILCVAAQIFSRSFFRIFIQSCVGFQSQGYLIFLERHTTLPFIYCHLIPFQHKDI